MVKNVKKENNKNNKKQSKARKIYNIVSSLIVAFVFIFLVFAVAIIVWGKVSGDDKPIFGHYIYDVVSGSMEPTIMTNESILCKKIDDVNTLQEGDIITFIAPSGQAKGYNITHRIVKIVRNSDNTINYIQTRGDAALESQLDPWKLAPNEVKAKYVKTLKGLGEFRQFLLTPVGYIVLIFIPLLTCGILFIISFVKDHTKKIMEKESVNTHVELNDLSDEEKAKLLDEIKSHDINESDTLTRDQENKDK